MTTISDEQSKENTMPAKVIDLALASKQVGVNEDTIKNMLGMLIEELPEHQANLNEAQQQNNLGELANIAHKLYGGSCYTGTPRLKKAAKDLELSVKTGKTADIDVCYQTLCEEIAAVLKRATPFIKS